MLTDLAERDLGKVEFAELFGRELTPKETEELGLEILATITTKDMRAAGIRAQFKGWPERVIADMCRTNQTKINRTVRKTLSKLRAQLKEINEY